MFCVPVLTPSILLPLNKVIMVLLQYMKYMHTVIVVFIVVFSRLQILPTCEEMLSAVIKFSNLVIDKMSSC